MGFCVWLRYKYGEKQKYLKMKLRMWSRLVRKLLLSYLFRHYSLGQILLWISNSFYCFEFKTACH